eukprot:gene10752-13156_t
MVHQQLGRLRESQNAALENWVREYRGRLGIALTDCISTDFFLKDFDLYFANLFDGLRHDSGDPPEWAAKCIRHYEKLGIDPQTKTLVFSDGLDLAKALKLYRALHGRIHVSFGIGTNLTCDIPGVEPMNIVIKMTACNGQPVAKISDTPGKTQCRDENFVTYLKHRQGTAMSNRQKEVAAALDVVPPFADEAALQAEIERRKAFIKTCLRNA